MQLCNQNLNQVPATVQRPRYDRSQVVGAIVHLGVGAFHRAHQAVAAALAHSEDSSQSRRNTAAISG